MSETTEYQSYINWTFNGTLHKASIGNGLINLIVRPANLENPDEGWKWQVNGATAISLKHEPMSVDAAKHAAESYAVMFCRSMISELT